MLHAFNLVHHDAVVVMDYNTQLQKPLQEEVNEFVADPNAQVKFVKDKDGGVSKNFMILKPSKEKFEEYRQEYINTPYDPVTGWNGEGFNNFKGKLGLKGFFSYKASKDPTWKELDRCTYNNQLDEECIQTMDPEDSKIIRHSKTVCGEPRDCPYNHPKWSPEKKLACQKAHAFYFKSRYELEIKHFQKPVHQERFGNFKAKSFYGYCKGPGKKNYLDLTQQIEREPEWTTICEPTLCPEGTYKKPDCSCTQLDEDPCNACPTNTRCQRTPELMCIDCNCGFCDNSGIACCEL